MKVLITGATGLIGRELGKALVQRGNEVFVISRDAEKAQVQLPFPCKIIQGNLSEGPIKNTSSLRLVDVVVNLAGESIGKGRWNESKKRRIYESRVLGTRHLIESLPVAPKIFINASAIGYYGSQGDKELAEESAAGDDFLAQVCQDWEEELLALSYGDSLTATRVAVLRTGMVLAPQGGAMDKLFPLFRRNMGGVLGNGKQWMSWIHIQDVIGLILHALERSSVRGPINLVSPQPVSNEEFTETLASVLGVKLAPRVPAFVLWGSLGEMAALVLASQKVIPQNALQSGYKFKFPELRKALEDVSPPDKEEHFVSEQYLPWPPERVFPFFSHAGNVAKITPPSLDFEFSGGPAEQLQKGSKVSYQLKYHGVPVKWKTRIDNWNPPHHFTDTQTEGPFKIWVHSHEFRPFANGTLVIDRVRYSLPLGTFGNFLGGAMVYREIEKVFHYRQTAIMRNLERDLGIAGHDLHL
ncbi:TIGR01777 family oxidoreductase [Bdellovibrio sp. HCB337]|uniref:TIGR01777 family oxidoreductase n=1 Tax=Bdellovibrio sp. HCB337 TaxID=3394358 RepID=UPI0039A4A564